MEKETNILIVIKKLIYFLMGWKEEEKKVKRYSDIQIENARYFVDGSLFSPSNYIHVSIAGNFILNSKLMREEKEQVRNTLKNRASEIKEKYNHKFNFKNR